MEDLKLHQIENQIFTIRDMQVMFDFHLADLYGTETKRLNEQVKRNAKRFPHEFMFQLTENEWKDLRSQIETTKKNTHLQSQIATSKRRSLPYVFSEQGVAMLSTVLNSDEAIEASVAILKAFVKMRHFLQQNASLFQRLDQLEIRQFQTEKKIEQVFKALDAGITQPDKGIFFDGQVFDAYSFIADLIKKAKSSITLIDNYIDETVLTLLSKRNDQVSATIYTKAISKTLELDLTKHNAQYPPVNVRIFSNSHDRFIIIDDSELYHLGASLKDLGKKWFAFSRMDSLVFQVLNQLLTH